MKNWLKAKWRLKSKYILAIVMLLVGYGMYVLLDDPKDLPANTGIFLGLLLALLVWLGPIVFVEVNKIKVRNPKDVFIEPSQWKIGVFFLGGSLVTAFVVLIIGATAQSLNAEAINNTDGVVGSMLMTFALLSILLTPVTVYMLNAHLRYKRIIQYKSAEWNRLHK